MTQDIHQEFERILKKKKVAPVYSFFKDLPPKLRRELMPTLKKLSKYYYEYLQMGNTWGTRGTSEQILILNIAIFVCATGKEYERIGSVWLESNNVKKIFEFYIPDWFGNYINIQSSKEGYVPFRMDYKWMMQLKNKGIIEPENHLIVKLLPEFLYDSEKIKNSYQHTYTRNDSKLLIYPVTLNEHIWLFFKEETNIHWTDHYMNYNDAKKDVLSWKQAFKKFANDGTIDRIRVLKESLATANMNFNKSSSGWFIDLFDMLEPTPTEMIKLQNDMMGVFNCPHSKPINVILKHFKKLSLEKGFATDDFLANTPILLTSETKVTVISTLMILAKLAKKHPKKAADICSFTTQALLTNDSAIQARAAKIIAAYGNPKDEQIVDDIANYKDVLLSEASNLLSPFISEETITEEVITEFQEPEDKMDILSNENSVQIPETIDDLMFLASEVFDHNNEIHFDIFPAALLNLNDKLTAENVDRFEPALQRSYKHVMGDWRSGIGLLDHMLCVFFIDFTNALIDRFKNGAIKLKKIRDVYHKKEQENFRQFRNHSRHLYPFRDWMGVSDSRIYNPFYKKLLFTLKELKYQNNAPILSTPTHHPFWIDPVVLIDRIKVWQDQKLPLGHADLQFAMSRTYLEDADKCIPKVKELEQGETQQLLSFLFDKNAKPQKPFKTIAHWWTAAMTKNPEQVYPEFQNFIYTDAARETYTGNYSWRVGKTAFSNSRYDYAKNKTVNFTDYRKMLTINLNPKSEVRKLFKNIFRSKTSPKLGQNLMIYSEIYFKKEWYETNDNDIKRFYGMVPNSPENLLARIIDKTLKYSEFYGETSKRMFINTIDQLLTQKHVFGNMAHLITAGGLICSDKTARSLTAELWVYAVWNDLLDNTKTGTFIGKYFDVEFAPLKRFTDLINDSLVRISPKHDAQLLLLIENILLKMNENPIRGLNKLLEIYLELLKKNKQKASSFLESNLKSWSSSKSLSKVLKLLSADY